MVGVAFVATAKATHHLVFGFEQVTIELLVHLFDGVVDEALSRFQEVELFDDDLVLTFVSLLTSLNGLFANPIVETALTTHGLMHVSIVLLNVFLGGLYLVLDLLRDVDNNLDFGVLTQVLTEIRILNVSGMLPTAIVFQKVEWKHASSECLGIWVVLEGPLHVDTTLKDTALEVS